MLDRYMRRFMPKGEIVLQSQKRKRITGPEFGYPAKHNYPYKNILDFSDISFLIFHFKVRNIHNEQKASPGPTRHIYIRPKENAVASTFLCVDTAGIKGVQVNIGLFYGVRIEHEAAVD